MGTGGGTCSRTEIIVKPEPELNKERTIAEIELELQLQSALALEPNSFLIEQQKKELSCELVTELKLE